MVMGGGGGGSRVWVRVLEKVCVKNVFFLPGHICNMQDSHGQKFSCLGELAQPKHAWASSRQIFAPIYFTAFVQRSYLTLQ